MKAADAVAELTRDFTAAGFDSARLDARILVGQVLGLEPSLLFARGDSVIPPADLAKLRAFAQRHLAHEPVSRILGTREFYGLPFKVTPDTLDPRPDTETLVDAVLELRGTIEAPRILDLGTGTGCIPLAILRHWPDATATGIDIAPGAVAAAAENARTLGLDGRAQFQVGDWTAGLAGPYDIVVSNPPYIADGEYAGLAAEVRLYDPRAALTAGPDGLAAYRALLAPVARLLGPNGQVFLEIGAGQGDAVAILGAAAGFRLLARRRDLAGIERCLHFGV
ncbi:MAG: peptide chain release factor N(5)-glutamine methyltransferase [Rhodospirillaceae bacterium]|nr:peptide chain release factor N(5)-glutamine methyltransferase [Rhodospirillaceae bacterium]